MRLRWFCVQARTMQMLHGLRLVSVRLSENFHLREFTKTNYSINNAASEAVIERLQTLVDSCLQPIRTAFGKTLILSGFRCPELNKAVGGVKNSAHLTGEAADFRLASCDNLAALHYIVENIDYQCLIWYPAEDRYHIDIKKDKRGKRLIYCMNKKYEVQKS